MLRLISLLVTVLTLVPAFASADGLLASDENIKQMEGEKGHGRPLVDMYANPNDAECYVNKSDERVEVVHNVSAADSRVVAFDFSKVADFTVETHTNRSVLGAGRNYTYEYFEHFDKGDDPAIGVLCANSKYRYLNSIERTLETRKNFVQMKIRFTCISNDGMHREDFMQFSLCSF